jgi:hypothetical protein
MFALETTPRRDVALARAPGAPARAPLLGAPTTLNFRAPPMAFRGAAFPRPHAYQGGSNPALALRRAALTTGPFPAALPALPALRTALLPAVRTSPLCPSLFQGGELRL